MWSQHAMEWQICPTIAKTVLAPLNVLKLDCTQTMNLLEKMTKHDETMIGKARHEHIQHRTHVIHWQTNINCKHPQSTNDCRERPADTAQTLLEGCWVAHHAGQSGSASCSAHSERPGTHLTLKLQAKQRFRITRNSLTIFLVKGCSQQWQNGHGSKERFLQDYWFSAELTKTQSMKQQLPTRSSWYWADSSLRVLSRSSCWSISFCKLLSSLWASCHNRFAHQRMATIFWGREDQFGIVSLSVRELIREPSNKRFLKQQAEKIDMGTHSVIQWQATLRSRTTWLRNSVQQLPVVATNINRTHTQATKH